MQFFLPLATSSEQAERLHARIAGRLREMGYELTPRRVARVRFRREGSLVSETVGDCSDNGEVVLAIFEKQTNYFVCTYSRGAVWGEPLVVHGALVESAELFDQSSPLPGAQWPNDAE